MNIRIWQSIKLTQLQYDFMGLSTYENRHNMDNTSKTYDKNRDNFV